MYIEFWEATAPGSRPPDTPVGELPPPNPHFKCGGLGAAAPQPADLGGGSPKARRGGWGASAPQINTHDSWPLDKQAIV